MAAKRRTPMPRGPMRVPKGSRPRKRGGYLECVAIEWEDSSYGGGWHYGEEPNKPATIRSVGILAKSSASSITIANSFDGDDGFLGRVTIPRSAIRKLRKLRV